MVLQIKKKPSAGRCVANQAGMDRAHLLLLGLPVFLFCSDVFNLFTPPPPKPPPPHHHHHHGAPHDRHPVPPQTLEFPTKVSGIGAGNTVLIRFCSSCSYKGNAVKFREMLLKEFPGIDVALENYPPTLPKRLLSKVVPVVQFGVIGVMMGGEHIFPRLGYAVPPPWYHKLKANRFGTISTTWLLGNFFQSFLQSSGAFEVYCNGALVFSKLQEHRFPGEIELKDLVSKNIKTSGIVNGNGESLWS